MRRDEESGFLGAYGESLALVRLHHQLLQLSSYDAVSREAWFDAARTLLATATNASERGLADYRSHGLIRNTWDKAFLSPLLWVNSLAKGIASHWDCFLWLLIWPGLPPEGLPLAAHQSFSWVLHDLEALLTVASEAKEWIAAHVLKR
jgi:hypothetical protein